MSARSGHYRCERCQRPTPKKRLTLTAVGHVCPRCRDHMPLRQRAKGAER